MKRILISIISLISTAFAIEVPATLSFVVDGDTVAVTINGQEERIRLAWIDTPESKDNSHGKAMTEGIKAKDLLKSLVKPGDAVVLWAPSDELERDVFKRLLAVLRFKNTSAQEEQIRAGYSVYWKKYGKCPDIAFDKTLNKLEQDAKLNKAGGWSTIPEWMLNKSHETTAKKRKNQ